ncbi:LysR family transcriptional regulator ArgP [Herbiconiux daphne]|uniref:LysR family transcriptional regulator ArgP n=1 Tax=Herbiconiux daphne TaxID=2970914 RepID=A0ABT2H2Y9_9MICO|nr:LysR family transcriptional regulator ArgP [Herbiconiux daphne]MCS5734305.1 LysR family transcriptional regulator ArgP [Herbiconiux daphne]
MQWDLAQLAALSAVVSEGTFEAAARALNITPSAVSQRVKALESSVGRVLLQRTKPVRATESGEAVLLLARQFETLSHDAMAGLGVEEVDEGAEGAETLNGTGGNGTGGIGTGGNGTGGLPRRPLVRMPIAVNADSLATWLLPALAELSTVIAFDLFREDQGHTTALLRDGTVMGAVTDVAQAVQGCSSTPLGAMRYRPMANRSFAARWFGGGVTPAALADAPVVVFDRRDQLQDRYLAAATGGVVSPPRHYVPASADFVEAVRLGFGWGMVPDLQSGWVANAGFDGQQTYLKRFGSGAAGDAVRAAAGAASWRQDSELVELDPAGAIDVPLYWQQWQLHTRSLERVASAIRSAAHDVLRPLA